MLFQKGKMMENIVLEYLRGFRAALDETAHDMSSLKMRVANLDVRMATGQLDIAHLHERHNQTDDRLRRMERRLGLRDSDG